MQRETISFAAWVNVNTPSAAAAVAAAAPAAAAAGTTAAAAQGAAGGSGGPGGMRVLVVSSQRVRLLRVDLGGAPGTLRVERAATLHKQGEEGKVSLAKWKVRAMCTHQTPRRRRHRHRTSAIVSAALHRTHQQPASTSRQPPTLAGASV